MSQYAELLRDPRWQKKRLEILSRDNFTCLGCGDQERTLHVHHCYYKKGNLPWEYADTSLATLCEVCHDNEADALSMKVYLSEVLSEKGCRAGHFHRLANAIEGSDFVAPLDEVMGALHWAIKDREIQLMLVRMYRDRIEMSVASNG